jgi:phosphoribosyl-ATP pyrophosphohydrolase/phosphoribosyl-AMP cyclohydrolase
MSLPIKFDAEGLVPTVIQDYLTGELRMFAFATDRAVRVTLDTGFATFWSRSRGELWQKGRASGVETPVVRVLADCDADCIVYSSDPTVASCNTGAASCFFQAFEGERLTQATQQPQTVMTALEASLQARKRATGGGSSDRPPSLDGRSSAAIGAKFRDRASEFASALETESADRVVAAAAGALYELVAGLVARSISWRSVLGDLSALRRRTDQGENA